MKYLRVLIVDAIPMTFGSFHELYPERIFDVKHDDSTDGYCITLADRHKLWSPKEEFESMYQEIQNPFPDKLVVNVMIGKIKDDE